MKNLFGFAFMVVALLPQTAQSETHASPFCPDPEEFNRTVQHSSKEVIDIIFSDSAYTDPFFDLGFSKPLASGELRMLQTETDSAVCQKLNERFDDLDSRLVYDRELRRYMPAWFVLYYEIQDRYVVFKNPYSPGEADGTIGLSSLGWTAVSVYDKKNLNLLGSFTL